MSSQQRSTWRAKQQDMKSCRKTFHGAVTYMFDGIFSWQMYGSADAVGSSRRAVAAILHHHISYRIVSYRVCMYVCIWQTITGRLTRSI